MQICDPGPPFGPSHLKKVVHFKSMFKESVFFLFSSDSFELSRKFAELVKHSNWKNSKSAISLRVFEKVQKVNQ
jgi:hypothetical protein